MYYLGIDSGGTKAAFLLGDETGKIYARHYAVGCTVLADGKEGVYRMVKDGVDAICEKAGITPDDIACLGLGISGYGEGENAKRDPEEACAAVLSPDRIICRCDTYVGWAPSCAHRASTSSRVQAPWFTVSTLLAKKRAPAVGAAGVQAVTKAPVPGTDSSLCRNGPSRRTDAARAHSSTPCSATVSVLQTMNSSSTT